jgi:hypothetical protein
MEWLLQGFSGLTVYPKIRPFPEGQAPEKPGAKTIHYSTI